jgi:hypothetical protein
MTLHALGIAEECDGPRASTEVYVDAAYAVLLKSGSPIGRSTTADFRVGNPCPPGYQGDSVIRGLHAELGCRPRARVNNMRKRGESGD